MNKARWYIQNFICGYIPIVALLLMFVLLGLISMPLNLEPTHPFERFGRRIEKKIFKIDRRWYVFICPQCHRRLQGATECTIGTIGTPDNKIVTRCCGAEPVRVYA